jgi:hypothetical protein
MMDCNIFILLCMDNKVFVYCYAQDNNIIVHLVKNLSASKIEFFVFHPFLPYIFGGDHG